MRIPRTGASDRDLVITITPFCEPAADIVVAAERAGGLGVLDLGTDGNRAHAALERVQSRWAGPFGVRVCAGFLVPPGHLPAEVDTLVVDLSVPAEFWSADMKPHSAAVASQRRVLAEVRSPEEAREAARRGAHGLIARGSEAGGRTGPLSTFVLVQRLLAEFSLPVWAMGGIGEHTAAAAVAGGARGVVIDTQLALTAEAGLPADVAAAISAMDGSETRMAQGHRVYARPDLPSIEPGPGRLGARGLREQLLPVGQDGAFAAELAGRYQTVGGVVQALRSAIASHIALAARIQPLADAVPVQGPMTRVSDSPQFAAEVAAAGGLPFLALALMPGDETRRLLADTGRLLGGQPWGVGILGFAPPELREAQLDAILEARPPRALIAGGRPSQAAALEQAGIETFLHVPSPGLLDQFVAAGARRFVFEGSECGGHIGPRGSFALWEAQISRLLRSQDLSGYSVWFAGGVHDERSAAMVAAMAAPLAQRGARVGVLMGTAYLFTQEATTFGAVLPGYQRAAVEATATALLETSPGHVTRCADTPYVATFEQARQRLADDGVAVQQAWAELEQLNLGRLRIAAKGLRRDGDQLAAVDEAVQRDEGMVMLGQVATMRSEVTTVAALHRQVTAGAAEFLAARAADLSADLSQTPAAPGAQPADVAIVGMACVYPGADDLGWFWANIVAGADAITEVPGERWRAEAYPHLPARGGFLRPVPFDALGYGIPPASLASIEPVQLLSLEVAARALADAGYARRPFDRERTSVIFGAEGASDLAAAYGLRSGLPSVAGQVPAELDAYLPRMTEDSFPGVLSNVIAGRIANRLDLGGANYTVDAACASSLAALDLACKELAAGSSDMVLCGGADTHNGAYDFDLFASVHALSPQGRCATFDASGDGIALGEGAGCVVLKRLVDAERDGDRIYGVIKAVASSSDGRSLGLTAPRPEGQRRALDRAYAAAGVSPAEVGLIEAHGTGTVVGDRTELATISGVFTEAGARPGSCTIGSVKSQIGHTKCAAGLAGLIKAALAVHTGVRPGTIHLSEPNPAWDSATSPFTFTAAGQVRPWATPPGQRHAGVSAFGFGGTNFHAVLSGYDGADEPQHGLHRWPAELFVFRGDTGAAADRLRRLITDNDAAGRPWGLAELAATMAEGTEPVRAALVASDLDDLAAKLGEPLPPQASAGRVAFLFPGQGSQRPGMLADLFAAFPRLQRLLRLGDARYADVMFPPAAFSREQRQQWMAAITDTRVAQPALGIAGLALHELLGALGVGPDLAGGHSYGELLALCAAGVYGESDLIDLSEIRATAILEAAGHDPGAMAAVTASATRVRDLLDSAAGDCPPIAEVVLANHNAPAQVVISGPTAAIEAAVDALVAEGLSARRIPVACAFHSPVVAPAAGKLASELADRDFRAPRFPVFANATAAAYPDDPDAMRDVLAGQVAQPVRFAEQVEAMYEAGARTFVETGPGQVLTALVGKILGDRPHTALACDVPGENGLVRLLTAVAGLVSAGVVIDPGFLFAGRVQPVSGTPKRPQWTVSGHLVRTADGQPAAGGLQPAPSAPLLVTAAGPDGSAPADDRERVVTDFLRSTRELVAAQRDIVLGFLGTAPVPAAVPATRAAAPARPGGTAAPIAEPAADPASATAAAAEPAAGPPPQPRSPATREEIGEAVVDIISTRTGYPRDMLGTDLDLEADLSIDSIKRTEIIGALAERLGLASDASGIDESVVVELAGLKTIAAIADWLATHAPAISAAAPNSTAPNGAAPSITATSTTATSTNGADTTVSTALHTEDYGPAEAVAHRGEAPGRYLVEAVEIDAAGGGGELPGPLLIVDDGCGIALELADLADQSGITTITVQEPTPEQLADCGALVHLGALRPGAGPVLPEGFGQFRAALLGTARAILVATAAGGTLGCLPADIHSEGADLGLRGMIRAIAAEYPDLLVRAVDVDPKQSPQSTGAQLFGELTSAGGPSVVGYRGGRRTGLRVHQAQAPAQGQDGPRLDQDSVVLLSGGARGITAAVARALARSAGCHIELIGRTPAPVGLDPEVASAASPAQVRQLLIQRGMDNPRQIETETGRLLREREVLATLGELRGAASSVRYHVIDVRDHDAVGDLVDDIYARHGRLDGVIHGAGLVEDRLVPDKTPESFARVYSTKVDGARALSARLHDDTRFFVLFGSVSGVFGNRGQVDYSAGNDALDTLAHLWAAGRPGRVLSVDWGPWAGGGMVSAELEREYARRGMTLIDPDAGVACLLAELAAEAGPPQVVYMTGDPADG